MGRTYSSLTEPMRRLIDTSQMFFVATAPADGRVNMSPKGYDTFRVIDDNQVCYLDVTGSGSETIAHLRENGRITLMCCAFYGSPNSVRLYGKGRTVLPGDEEWDDLRARFGVEAGVRAIIVADIDRTSTSCGKAVPYMTFDAERTQLRDHWNDKSPNDLADYWAEKNSESIDGLPSIDPGLDSQVG